MPPTAKPCIGTIAQSEKVEGRGRLEMSEIGEEEGNMSRTALTRAERLASVPLWSTHKYSRSRGHLCRSICGVVHARAKREYLATTVPWMDF